MVPLHRAATFVRAKTGQDVQHLPIPRKSCSYVTASAILLPSLNNQTSNFPAFSWRSMSNLYVSTEPPAWLLCACPVWTTLEPPLRHHSRPTGTNSHPLDTMPPCLCFPGYPWALFGRLLVTAEKPGVPGYIYTVLPGDHGAIPGPPCNQGNVCAYLLRFCHIYATFEQPLCNCFEHVQIFMAIVAYIMMPELLCTTLKDLGNHSNSFEPRTSTWHTFYHTKIAILCKGCISQTYSSLILTLVGPPASS